MSSSVHSCIVVIPVYKSEMSNDEQKSLLQCLTVLRRYPIVFVSPNKLNCNQYISICSNNNILFQRLSFDDSFFDGISSYNRLLLSRCFYEAFSDYEYMLIYQLDAYVFRDELESWCKKGYDYVGAPLIGHYSDVVFSDRMRVGNGGLSLRKVHSFLSFFDSSRNVYPLSRIADRIGLLEKPFIRVFIWLFMALGWRNKPSVVAKRWRYNEDEFWSCVLLNTNYAMFMPTPFEALLFSFERFPSELYEMNGRKLPFGCHAWRKYQYDSFWSRFIF